MCLQSPLLSSPLSEQLRRKTNELRSRIVRTNYNTQFAQTAPELSHFRHATAGLLDGMDDDVLFETFQKTVPFTTYDSYAPFIARFYEKPCQAAAIVDLLAPGMPDCLFESSSTSGGVTKRFPRRTCLSNADSDSGPWTIADPSQRRTRAFMWYLGYDRMDVQDGNDAFSTIYVSSGSAIVARMDLHLDPNKDEEKMGTFIFNHTAPYAAAFIKKWRSFLLIQALFALGSRSVETMSMVFITTFVDLIRYLDVEFDLVMDCIENGTIPDLDGIADVRRHLELNIVADPERAAELRRIGRPSSRPGWCAHAWPKLRSITSTASGSFASSVPLAKWFLGPGVDLHAFGYVSSEAWIGSTYDLLELNQYKLRSEDVFEFLDINKNDAIDAITQVWEVEVGKRYELVLTTREGLWRYRLGDVVEIYGFDATDGMPIIQFIERRNVAIRLSSFMLTDQELRAAMSFAVLNTPVKVVNWTTTIDDLRSPATIGFFIELADGQVSDLAYAPERLLGELSGSNEELAAALARGELRKPTIWLVRAGTFSDFLQSKLDEGTRNSGGQIKVPVVLPKAKYVTWFANQVVQEL